MTRPLLPLDRRTFLDLGLRLAGFALSVPAFSQVSPNLLKSVWPAKWVVAPGASPHDYGVFHFRRTFVLEKVPRPFVVHVTADNRYRLFVNGKFAAAGPARGDLNHWHYETLDLAPLLREGHNALAAVVWNDGAYAAVAQFTSQTGFLMQGDSDASKVVNTGPDWYSIVDRAYRPLRQASPLSAYSAIPPGELLEGSSYPWGWETNTFDDGIWRGVENVDRGTGSPRDARDGPNRWMLTPRTIPPMEETPQRFGSVRRQEGLKIPPGFPEKSGAFQVPAKSSGRFLLDQGHLTTAFPELVVSGGLGARITMRYAESLYLPGPTPERPSRDKGNRNDVEGKLCFGTSDMFGPDGERNRVYRPLYWRTFRYVDVTVDTSADPVTIDDLRSVYTGYPFTRKATFETPAEANAELQKILDVGWRTARLCAHETYMDCPYYEQLQYAGDTRIQCLVSLYNSGDSRLVRQAIEQLDASRTAEGATLSRAPSALQQYIPGFSLWWIGMVHDYWMYAASDPEQVAFVAQMLPGVRAVLSFFAAHQHVDGSLGEMPWWNYVDWVDKWPGGVPPRGPEGASAPQDLQLLMALNWAARLETALGKKSQAADNTAAAEKLRATIRTLYWDGTRGLFADTPQHNAYSQHANALAVLAEVATGAEARTVMERAVAPSATTLAQCSVYFRYYLHQAMVQAGLGDRYLEMLEPWKQQLAMGVSTWPEEFRSTSRSDCHAWGASPNIELFRTVLGVESLAPGFRRVLVRPHLGKLPRASGTIPHPNGEISVRLDASGAKPSAQVTLPAGVDGELRWKGITRPLVSGKNEI
jgi:alpha-L-rhamnosidase